MPLSNLIWLRYQITDAESLTFKGDMLICHILCELKFHIRCKSKQYETYK